MKMTVSAPAVAILGAACASADPFDELGHEVASQIDLSASTDDLYYELVRLHGLGLVSSERMDAVQRALDEVDAREPNPVDHAEAIRVVVQATLRRTYAEMEEDPEALQGWEGRRYAERLHRTGVREANARAEEMLLVAGMVGIPTSKGELALVIAAPVGGYVVARVAGVAFKRVPLLLRRFRTADALIWDSGKAGIRARYIRSAEGLAGEIGGKPMDPERFARMKAAFERQGGTIWQDAEAQRYLAHRNAEAITWTRRSSYISRDLAHRPSSRSSFMLRGFGAAGSIGCPRSMAPPGHAISWRSRLRKGSSPTGKHGPYLRRKPWKRCVAWSASKRGGNMEEFRFRVKGMFYVSPRNWWSLDGTLEVGSRLSVGDEGVIEGAPDCRVRIAAIPIVDGVEDGMLTICVAQPSFPPEKLEGALIVGRHRRLPNP